jgi:hypothetical protein
LNFFLVVFSIVIAGAINSKTQSLFEIILWIGAIICWALAVTIFRASKKLDIILKDLFKDETHPVRIVDKLAGGLSVRWILGYLIPVICCTILTLGAVLSVCGTLTVVELNRPPQLSESLNIVSGTKLDSLLFRTSRIDQQLSSIRGSQDSLASVIIRGKK